MFVITKIPLSYIDIIYGKCKHLKNKQEISNYTFKL